jgi:hypothetical protein
VGTAAKVSNSPSCSDTLAVTDQIISAAALPGKLDRALASVGHRVARIPYIVRPTRGDGWRSAGQKGR